MKKLFGAVGALILTATLAGCSTSAAPAHDLVEDWLAGDTSVRCAGASSTWTAYVLGGATLLETVDGVERWAVDISGSRSGAPASGSILVDIGDEQSSCVRWYEEAE